MTEAQTDAEYPASLRLKSLNEQLNDASLKSSARVLILIILAMNRKMSAVQLRGLTGLGKGSIENHLDKLEAAGYVRVTNVKVFGGNGKRQNVEVTEKGMEQCRALLRTINGLTL